MEFRKRTSDKSNSKRRTVDGFVSNNSSLDPGQRTLPQTELDSISKRSDGFSPQNQIDSPFSKALENHATLPNLDLDMSSEHDEKPKKKRSKLKATLKGFGIFTSAALVCGLLVGGFIFGKAWIAKNKIFKGGGKSSTLFSTDIKPEKLKGEGDGRINILLVGAGGGNHPGADLTDSIVIASIDPVAKDIALLSIPRDLWVKVPNYWTMKINAAYVSSKNRALDNGSTADQANDAGFATLEETIQQYIGIPIHYHALVNFQGFIQGVDAVGGFDVNVQQDLYDSFIMADNDNNPLIAKKGLQHFDGRHGLLYAQSRHSTSDFDRGERQRLVLIALKEKLLNVGTFSNPKTISKLIDALGNNVSINATLGEMMRMYDITKDIPSTSIATLGLTDESSPLVTTGNVDDQSVVIPRAGINDFSQIQSFVRNAMRDPFLKSEDASIAILNGTGTPGLATKKANELKSFGYRVTIIDDAPTKDHATTIIYDKTAGVKKFTRNYLEKRLGVTTSKDPVPADILATADFVVVLGKDADTQSTN